MSRIALLVVVVATSVGLVAAASAQTYPPSGCELQLSTTRIVPGGTVRVDGCGFLPAATVRFALRVCGSVIGVGSVRADRDGRISTTLEIPEDVPGGKAVLQARGRGTDGRMLVLQGVSGVDAPCASEEVSGHVGLGDVPSQHVQRGGFPPTPTRGRAAAPSSETGTRGGQPNTGTDLANTGIDLALVVAVSAALVAAGLALRRIRRRQN